MTTSSARKHRGAGLAADHNVAKNPAVQCPHGIGVLWSGCQHDL
jgi:hypothetical protein